MEEKRIQNPSQTQTPIQQEPDPIEEELTSTRLQVVQERNEFSPASYGDCFILQFDETDGQRKHWLIDGGPGNQSFAGSYKIVNHCLFGALNHLEIPKLDRLIVTHDDKDHIYGISTLLTSLIASEIVRQDKQRSKMDSLLLGLHDICKMTRWGPGHQKLTSDKKFPIDAVWYNDRLFVSNFNNRKGTRGWMKSLLEKFNTIDGHKDLNSEWPNVNDKEDARIISREQYISSGRQFSNIAKISGPSNADLVRVEGHLNSTLKIGDLSIGDARKAVLAQIRKFPTTLNNWFRMDTPNVQGVDNSNTNLSSIMFEFVDRSGARILMTGDGTGDRLYESYPQKETFDIIKLMHHGSSNNNVLSVPNTDNSTVIKRGRNFFSHFIARKYVISSDTLNTCPNPDFDCLHAFAEEVEANADLQKTRLYLTNGVTASGWRTLNQKWDQASMGMVTRDHVARIYVLKHSDTIDYGSVVPTRTNDPSTKETEAEDNWVRLETDNNWRQYMIEELPHYWTKDDMAMDSSSLIKNRYDVTHSQRYDNDGNLKTFKQIKGTRIKKQKSQKPMSAIDEEIENIENMGRRTGRNRKAPTNFDDIYNKLISFASGGVTLASPNEQAPKMEWHDIMMMRFLEEKRLDVLSLRAGPIPVPQQIASAGSASSGSVYWVDLLQYLSLLETDYKSRTAQYNAGRNGRNMLTHIASMRSLFTSKGQESPVLAAAFMSTLFDKEFVADFFVSLPINFDGTEVETLDPLMDIAPCSVFDMLVSDIRLQVFVPTQTDYSKGKGLEVLEMMFDLSTPIKELWNSSPESFMIWNVPFRSGRWTPRKCYVQHKEKLRFRMLWPFTQNSLTLCFFAGSVMISNTVRKELGLKGSMCFKRGFKATYDFQIHNVGSEDLRIIDIFEMLSPTAAIAGSLIRAVATEIELPGVNLKEMINDTLALHKVGIVLRQHDRGLRVVTIDDVYGTIKLDGLAQLAQDVLGIPKPLRLKSKLPDLTLQVANITGRQGHRYSCAFTYEIEGSTVAVQYTVAKQGGVRFDLWIICRANFSVANWLKVLGQHGLLPEFEQASLFTDALSHLFVPFVHLTVGKIDSGSWTLLNLDLAVALEDVSLPAKEPVLTLEQVTMDLSYSMLSKNLSVYVEATLNLGGYDAICTVLYDKNEKAIDDFLTNKEDESSEKTGDTASNTTLLDMKVSFPTKGPSIGGIIQGLLGGDVNDPTGLNSLSKNIPEDFLIILTSNDFQNVELRLEKSGEKGAKWTITYLFISVRLDGLQEVLQKVLPSMEFEVPRLIVMLNNLGDREKRSYNVSLSGVFGISASFCQLKTDFGSPPPGTLSAPEKYFSLQFNTKPGSPALPIGKILQHYVDDKFDTKSLTPEELHKAIDSVTIKSALVSFAKATKAGSAEPTWGMNVINISVSLFSEQWKPFDNFAISDVELYLSHDFARSPSTEIDPKTKAVLARKPTTAIQFSGRLHLKKTEFYVAFTYESNPTAYSFNLIPKETLDIVKLILDSIDLAIDIPSEIRDFVASILVIKTENFFISHSKADRVRNLPETVVFSNQGEISLFGIGVSNISIFCEKTNGSSWSSYTVSFALPTPCAPLKSFLSGIAGVDGIKILNSRFSYFKNSPSSRVFTTSQLSVARSKSSSAKNSLMLSGTLDLTSSVFLRTVSSIVSISIVDLCVQSDAFTVALPVGSKEISFLDILKLETFSLSIALKGFALGVSATLTADWFTKIPVSSTLTLKLETSGAVGGEVSFSKIEEPFGMPGLYLDDSRFGMVFLTEAASPQSAVIKGGILMKDPPGAEQIKASLDMSIDVLNPLSSYLKMDIENLTLANLIKAMTRGSLPSPLDSDYLRLGFKKLKVDIVPKDLHFSLDAEFYLFALAGKVKAEVDIKTGISFAANLEVVNILGMLKIHSYHDDKKGPFIFLDSKAKSIQSGDMGPPPWLGVTSKDDSNLKNCIFALSGCISLLGIEMKVYGIINTRGLEFILATKADIAVPGFNMHFSSQFTMSINKERLSSTMAFNLDFGLDFEDVNLFGVSLGSFKGSLFSLKSSLALTVTYGGNDWRSDGVEFSVAIDVTLLGMNIKGTCTFGITLRSIADLISAIKSWVQQHIMEKLKAFIKPVVEFVQDVGKKIGVAAHEIDNAIDEGVGTLKDFFNASAFEVVNILTEAGHTTENITKELKNVLDLGISECASVLADFGHDINRVIGILDNVFSPPRMDIMHGLYLAGFDSHRVVESAFGPILGAGAIQLVAIGAIGGLLGGSIINPGAINLMGGAVASSLVGNVFGAAAAVNILDGMLGKGGINNNMVGGILVGASPIMIGAPVLDQLMKGFGPATVGSIMGLPSMFFGQVAVRSGEDARQEMEQRQREAEVKEEERRREILRSHSMDRVSDLAIPVVYGLDIPGFHTIWNGDEEQRLNPMPREVNPEEERNRRRELQKMADAVAIQRRQGSSLHQQVAKDIGAKMENLRDLVENERQWQRQLKEHEPISRDPLRDLFRQLEEVGLSHLGYGRHIDYMGRGRARRLRGILDTYAWRRSTESAEIAHVNDPYDKLDARRMAFYYDRELSRQQHRKEQLERDLLAVHEIDRKVVNSIEESIHNMAKQQPAVAQPFNPGGPGDFLGRLFR